MIHDSGTFKGWIHSDYLDEVVPGQRATPDDWLKRHGDVLMIDHCDEDGDPLLSDEPTTRVDEGDLVSFYGLTEFGFLRVEIAADGSYRALDPVPREATSFWLKGDMDTTTDTLADFVKSGLDNGYLEPGIVDDIECYDWSERTFRLKDGVFVLVPAEIVGHA